MGGRLNIAEIFDEMLEDLIEKKATDIHFQPIMESNVKVKYRLANELCDYKELSEEEYSRLLMYVKYTANLDISNVYEPQDGSIIKKINQKEVNLRLSTIPLYFGESLVIRIITKAVENDQKQLIWQEQEYDNIFQCIYENSGLYVFTGPTGSGKTTLMYSILEELSKLKQQKVVTIENPIEIKGDKFIQIQVNEARNLTYDVAIKAVLRQDPDIIMIGEIRDLITAKAVMRAALTGHRVITTMHTKDKLGVVNRLLDFGFLKSEIEAVLIGVSNQRIVEIDGETKIFVDNENLTTKSGWEDLEQDGQSIIKKIEVFKRGF